MLRLNLRCTSTMPFKLLRTRGAHPGPALSLVHPSYWSDDVALSVIQLRALSSVAMSSRDRNVRDLNSTGVRDYPLADQSVTLSAQYRQARISSAFGRASSALPSSNN